METPFQSRGGQKTTFEMEGQALCAEEAVYAKATRQAWAWCPEVEKEEKQGKSRGVGSYVVRAVDRNEVSQALPATCRSLDFILSEKGNHWKELRGK